MGAKQVKYDQIYGGDAGASVIVAASQVIFAASAKFVKRTGASTGTVTKAGATDTNILGYLACEELNSSDGTEVRKCITDPTAVFRIPVGAGTFTRIMIGKKCDLMSSSSVQSAALNSASYGVLEIVDGDLDDNSWVDVRVNYRNLPLAAVV